MLMLLSVAALMAATMVASAFPAMAYHEPECWIFDENFGWFYWCDDYYHGGYDDYGSDIPVDDCWEWSDVFEEWQWDCE